MPSKLQVYQRDFDFKYFIPTLWKNSNNKQAPKMCYDETTDDYYRKDPRLILSIKHLTLAIFVPLIHGMLAAIQVAIGIWICLTLFLQYLSGNNTAGPVALKTLQKLALLPLVLVALELTAIVGIFLPLNARKIFANLERFLVNNYETHKIFNTARQCKNKNFNNPNYCTPKQTSYIIDFENNKILVDMGDKKSILYDSFRIDQNRIRIRDYRYFPSLKLEFNVTEHTGQVTIQIADVEVPSEIKESPKLFTSDVYDYEDKNNQFIMARCFQPLHFFNKTRDEDASYSDYQVENPFYTASN